MLPACLAPALLSAAVRWGDALKQPPEWYAGADARAVADNVLLHQFPSGGWPKNIDMARPLSAAERAALEKRLHDEATIDNGATTAQVRFLARVLAATDEPRYRAAAERGVDYLLAAQYPNGGWPQFFPLRPGYYTRITFNDDAMADVMELLREAAAGRAPWAFVDAARRARCEAAFARGLGCILRAQVVVAGRKTVWCAQHDEVTLAPAPARKFEPVSLSGRESVGLVRLLMSVPAPTPEIVAAVEAAGAWLAEAKITGFRVEDFSGREGRRDRRTVADPAAPPLWARFYDVASGRPLFMGRDEVVHHDFNEIERERRTGYAYLGDWPAKLLERDLPRWRQKHNRP